MLYFVHLEQLVLRFSISCKVLLHVNLCLTCIEQTVYGCPLCFLSTMDAVGVVFVLFLLSNSGVGKICSYLNISILSCGFSLTFFWA